ncbi:MAG TPA: heavy-metal-associated domain-containing protein [Segetibacter sp.]|jgi:copper chaperone CopZ
MKTIELKTNIMCGSCIAKVTPTLNEKIGEGNWKVDTLNPKKVLTVTTEDLDKSQIIEAVQKAGYKAEELA